MEEYSQLKITKATKHVGAEIISAIEQPSWQSVYF